MSVLIKGMEMPKNCLWCPLQYIGICQVTKKDVNSDLGRRADDCPLVELPEKHGRLFDTDEVIKCLEELEPDCKEKAWAIGLVEWAIAKRWCIEAEGEG